MKTFKEHINEAVHPGDVLTAKTFGAEVKKNLAPIVHPVQAVKKIGGAISGVASKLRTPTSSYTDKNPNGSAPMTSSAKRARE